MALAEPTRHAPTLGERGVDARLADALDHLLGALDHLPANEHDETRPQRRLSDGRGWVPSWRELLGFVHLLGPRLRHSQRLPYRIGRLVAVWFAYCCVTVGIIVMLLRLLGRQP
jgi:hypothetical protein